MPHLTLRARAWHGDESISLPVPDGWRVSTSRPPDAGRLPAEGIREALSHPIGAAPLVELAAGAKSAAVVVEDITRPCPTAELVAAILERLHQGGLSAGSIRFVTALGGHRQMPRAEMVAKLGEDVVGRYEVLNHDVSGEFVEYGRTERGTPIRIFAPVATAELKILVGTCYPRMGTGYGGGAKCLVPGVAALDTIRSYHSRAGGPHLDPDSEMRQEIEEIARRVGVQFLVNAVLNARREIASVCAGDVIAAHRAAAARVRELNRMPVLPEADVVIANAYPFDTNLRYVWRGTWAFESHPRALKVLVDFSPEGAGYHQVFKAKGRPFAPPPERPLWHLYSPLLGPREVNEVLPDTQLHREWESVLALVRREAGESPRVAFYPEAGTGWRAEAAGATVG